MAGASDDWERVVLDILYGPDVYGSGVSGDVPDTYHVGLFTVMPTDSAPGTELGVAGYARAILPNTPSNWNPAATVSGITSKTNVYPVTFPTASVDWAVDPVFIVGYGLFTANLTTDGLLTTYSALTTPKEVHAGDTPSLGAGLIVVRLD